jgi:hypothetical protein
MRRKEGQYENHFPTWDAAKAHIVFKAEREVEVCRAALARAISSLDVARKIAPSHSDGGTERG